jgi:hypothetical protein
MDPYVLAGRPEVVLMKSRVLLLLPVCWTLSACGADGLDVEPLGPPFGFAYACWRVDLACLPDAMPTGLDSLAVEVAVVQSIQGKPTGVPSWQPQETVALSPTDPLVYVSSSYDISESGLGEAGSGADGIDIVERTTVAGVDHLLYRSTQTPPVLLDVTLPPGNEGSEPILRARLSIALPVADSGPIDLSCVHPTTGEWIYEDEPGTCANGT